jgi:hypothetical protein
MLRSSLAPRAYVSFAYDNLGHSRSILQAAQYVADARESLILLAKQGQLT